jgi:hypothetical protein
MKLRTDYRERLAALGFTQLEINAVTLVLVRIGVTVPGITERPKFVFCLPLDEDAQITDLQWNKGMQEAGFFESSILVANYALGLTEGAD